jgi:hypothetical protein
MTGKVAWKQTDRIICDEGSQHSGREYNTMENGRYHTKASRKNMKELDILTQTTFERQIIMKEHGSHTIIPNPSQRLPETGSFL